MTNGSQSTTPSPQPALADWLTWQRFALGLALLIFATHWDVLVGGKSFYVRDYSLFGYPLAHYHRECFWRGELPFWNPYNSFGMPFLAQWNTLTLYPGSLIYLLLPLPWSLNLFCLAHLLLGGVGMFLWMREQWGSPWAACVAGCLFAVNGFTFSALMWPNNTATWAWLPWVIWSVGRACRQGGRWIPGAALIAAMQLLAGGPEIIIQTWLLAGFLMIIQLRHFTCGPWRVFGRIVAVVVWAAALAAVQLLPFLELLQQSQRSGAWAAGEWSMPAWGWLNLFVPLFSSRPVFQGVYMQTGHGWVNLYYPGILAALFALLTVVRVRHRLVSASVVAVLAGVLLAQGENGFIYQRLGSIFPSLGYVRYPVKFVLLALALLPVLAAAGVHHCLSSGNQFRTVRRDAAILGAGYLLVLVLAVGLDHYLRQPGVAWQTTLVTGLWRVLFFVVAMLLLLRLRASVRLPQALACLAGIGAIIGADACLLGKRPSQAASSWVYEDQLVRQELDIGEHGPGAPRFLSLPSASEVLQYTSLPAPEEHVAYLRMGLHANVNLIDRLPKASGFYSLNLKEYEELMPLFYQDPIPPHIASLARCCAIGWTQVPGKAIEWTNAFASLPPVTAGHKPLTVPREHVLAALADGRLDLESAVILDGPDAAALGDIAPGQARVTSLDWREQSVRFTVTATAPSLVVLALPHYPAWAARAGEEVIPLWRANHLFTALKVPAGTHEVVIEYQDQAFRRGLVISMVALLVALAVFVLPSLRRIASGTPQ